MFAHHGKAAEKSQVAGPLITGGFCPPVFSRRRLSERKIHLLIWNGHAGNGHFTLIALYLNSRGDDR